MAASELNFTLESLRTFLQHLLTLGPVYRFCDRPRPEESGFLLRHDVDLDIVPAVGMAAVELEAGVRSSFFVMMTNEFYNPAAPPERRLLQQLVSNGFEVGLHFDPTVYGQCSPAQLQE